MTYKAEYIWIDGTEPTPLLRSKTKILTVGAELPIWGFDGSSTNQAPGEASDCVLKPVFSCPDPIRGGHDVLVLCEVLDTDMQPHSSNTRAALAEVAERHQVLVITHLPQIAARADRHLVVSKQARGGIATSDVQSIHGEDRVGEIARMLGDTEGDAARRHAQALLRKDAKARR